MKKQSRYFLIVVLSSFLIIGITGIVLKMSLFERSTKPSASKLKDFGKVCTDFKDCVGECLASDELSEMFFSYPYEKRIEGIECGKECVGACSSRVLNSKTCGYSEVVIDEGKLFQTICLN